MRTFNSTAEEVISETDTEIVAVVAHKGDAGAVALVLDADTGASLTTADAASYLDASVVTDISPNVGQLGTEVTITGARLLGGGSAIDSVTFGDQVATLVTSDQDDAIDVVDVGGGTTEVAIISLNGVVYRDSVRVGGDRFDEAIVSHVRRRYGSLIGDATAERIKLEVGCAFPGSEMREIDVRGRNLAEGVPRSFTLNSDEILESLKDPLESIVQAVKSALEQSPPELAADIAESGIVLTGGGALLRDLDRLISEETGLPVIVADDPLTCVARGGGIAMERMDRRTIDLLSTE